MHAHWTYTHVQWTYAEHLAYAQLLHAWRAFFPATNLELLPNMHTQLDTMIGCMCAYSDLQYDKYTFIRGRSVMQPQFILVAITPEYTINELCTIATRIA